jgi:serine/threonine-protein kinase HipA
LKQAKEADSVLAQVMGLALVMAPEMVEDSLMTDDKVLAVRLYGERIGLLEQTPTGKIRFTYIPESARQLSIGMPVQAEPFDEVRTEAYFGGLLPESEMARKAIGKRYGVNHHNSFSLLKAIGYDCAGAVSLHPVEELINPESVTSFPLTGRVLSEQELYQHIQDLPKKPLFLGVEGLRLSLAGAQDKAAVCLINNEVALPQNGCPTTHILKPVIQGFDGMVHNEYLCLRLAARIGLTVPHVEIRWAQDVPYLLIERYDRIVQNNQVQRIHQEDFCQALGIVSGRKYQSDGGPDFKACFDLLYNTTQPVKDRNALAALMVFNYLIGNMDAHGKNFSLLHRPMRGQAMGLPGLTYAEDFIELTPVYDVVCTRAYKDLAEKMAMKIGGYYEPDKILPRHWERQCKEMGYSFPALRETLNQQALAILDLVHSERSQLIEANLFHPIVDEMMRFFEKHIGKTLERFKSGA